MATLLNESLETLSRLSPRKLHHVSRVHRATLGSAEWHLALCLLAAVHTMAYRTLGYSNITEYAERGLNLSGRKAGALLSAARALQHLPILSEAFRTGQICWAKLRAFVGLATPADERAWLEFAMNHRIDQILRRVAQSPKEWKRQQALKAALEGKPLASEADVGRFLAHGNEMVAPPFRDIPPSAKLTDDTAETSAASAGDGISSSGRDSPGLAGSSVTPPGLAERQADEGFSQRGEQSPISEGGVNPVAVDAPISSEATGFVNGPRVIRMVVEFAPDQFALYERAEGRVRAKLGKRLTRAKILTYMAEAVLDAGDARSRAKHQVVVHTDATGDHAWYETGRGLLPVNPSVLEQARKKGPAPIDIPAKDSEETAPLTSVTGDSATDARPRSVPPSGNRRPVPNGVLRQLVGRAGHQCERCGQRSGLLEVHHRKPVSEGGTNNIEDLWLLCGSCHGFEHEKDFLEKPHWAAGRAASQTNRERRKACSAQGGSESATD